MEFIEFLFLFFYFLLLIVIVEIVGCHRLKSFLTSSILSRVRFSPPCSTLSFLRQQQEIKLAPPKFTSSIYFFVYVVTRCPKKRKGKKYWKKTRKYWRLSTSTYFWGQVLLRWFSHAPHTFHISSQSKIFTRCSCNFCARLRMRQLGPWHWHPSDYHYVKHIPTTGKAQM